MEEKKTQKNPLNQAFGMVLRKARETRSWSYQDLQTKSGLKSSYIQQVEKGQFNLHVSNCIALHKTFRSDVTQIGVFSLEGLMQLLSIISVLEAKGRESKSYMKGLKETAKQLSGSDRRMEKLFEKFLTHKIFDAKSSDEATSLITTSGADDVVEDFLINYKTFAKTEIELHESYPHTFFKDFPTDKLEFLQNIKTVVKKLPSSYDYRMSWKWEKENKHLFRNSFILDKNPEVLTGYENLSSYQYEYLWENNFEKTRILLLDGFSSENWLNIFRTNLKKSLNDAKKQDLLSHFDKAMKKLEIKCVTSKQQTTLADSIICPNDDNKYNATWAFSLSNHFNVGVRAFINTSDARLTLGDYLDFDETLNMMRDFLNLWETI